MRQSPTGKRSVRRPMLMVVFLPAGLRAAAPSHESSGSDLAMTEQQQSWLPAEGVHGRSQPVLWDLYCGIGTIGLSLASQCHQVIGIDGAGEINTLHNLHRIGSMPLFIEIVIESSICFASCRLLLSRIQTVFLCLYRTYCMFSLESLCRSAASTLYWNHLVTQKSVLYVRHANMSLMGSR